MCSDTLYLRPRTVCLSHVEILRFAQSFFVNFFGANTSPATTSPLLFRGRRPSLIHGSGAHASSGIRRGVVGATTRRVHCATRAMLARRRSGPVAARAHRHGCDHTGPSTVASALHIATTAAPWLADCAGSRNGQGLFLQRSDRGGAVGAATAGFCATTDARGSGCRRGLRPGELCRLHGQPAGW